jgi:hypothetical protein
MTNLTSVPPHRTYRDHLDLACEQLSDELAAERIEHQHTRQDRDAYRLLLQLTLTQLSEAHERNQRQRERVSSLLEELRSLRHQEAA